ncbi:MAG TPA: hypothetical protein VLZ83_01565 [Edaphocola sp.]|nr:hypothetical protein [Edaphocola sp.]
MSYKNSIFTCKPIPNGHTWTIVSKFGRILKVAEEKYGQRDKLFTILGIELNQLDYPQIWFPEHTNNIIIQLTSDCLYDINRAVYQLAHEAIHCLNPVLGEDTNYLEEGLATHFALEYTKLNGYGNWEVSNPAYAKALSLVEQIFKIEPQIIEKIKVIKGNLFFVERNDLLNINKNIPELLAEELTRKFNERTVINNI